MKRLTKRTFERERDREVAAALRYVEVFPDQKVQRLAFAEAEALSFRGLQETYKSISGDFMGRGERWSLTYHSERSRMRAEIAEAVADALRGALT